MGTAALGSSDLLRTTKSAPRSGSSGAGLGASGMGWSKSRSSLAVKPSVQQKVIRSANAGFLDKLPFNPLDGLTVLC